MGKTSLIMMLEQAFKLSTYYWPRDEKWWDGYSDNEYDLIVLDEFFTQKTITELNPILSGDPVPLSRRGLSPIVKRQNLPVIILSNYTPEECFTRVAVQQPHKIAPLLDRLIVVQATGPIRLVATELAPCSTGPICLPVVGVPHSNSEDASPEYEFIPDSPITTIDVDDLS